MKYAELPPQWPKQGRREGRPGKPLMRSRVSSRFPDLAESRTVDSGRPGASSHWREPGEFAVLEQRQAALPHATVRVFLNAARSRRWNKPLPSSFRLPAGAGHRWPASGQRSRGPRDRDLNPKYTEIEAGPVYGLLTPAECMAQSNRRSMARIKAPQISRSLSIMRWNSSGELPCSSAPWAVNWRANSSVRCAR